MKTVLVTGANSGIGLATTRLFLKEGYSVIAHYNQQKHNLESLCSKNLSLFQADFLNLNEVDRLIQQLDTLNKNIDILINNAGVYEPKNNLNEIDIDTIDRIMNVNFKAPFLLSKYIVQNMRKNLFGRIINISSIGLKYGGAPSTMAYAASKAALEVMTVSFSKEYAPYNILVNSLRVGVTNTTFHQANINKNMLDRIEKIPMKRMADANEIAEMIFFLSSDKNSYTTGSVITIAGGE